MKIIIEVKIINSEAEVRRHYLETYDGEIYWELQRIFEQLGEKMSDILDPNWRKP